MKRLPEHEGDISNPSQVSPEAKVEGKQPATPARREFLRTSLLGTAAIATAAARPLAAREDIAGASNGVVYSGDVPAFELDEVTISELQDAMKSGKLTSRSITEKYLARIDQIDKQGPAINAIIELNPDALSIAATMTFGSSFFVT